MNKCLQVKTDSISVNARLAKHVLDECGDVLIEENTVLTEHHLALLVNHQVESVYVSVEGKYSAEEIKKYKKEQLAGLRQRFKYFESGKKKDALIKMFLTYKMRQYNE